jgi:DNA polymerase-4
VTHDPQRVNGPVAPHILHVDLDAFYASVEQLEDPSLQGRPVIVGGLGPRGVVAAASYEARRYGVRSAMPMARARRACADGVFLAPRFDLYQARSRSVMEILHSFTPLVEPIASDEAFLDVSGSTRTHGSGPECAVAIRERVRDATGLTASVGVALTKLLAKLASDLAKPDGLLVVEPGTELDFLHPLPVERLSGVGPATQKRLAGLGVVTVGDLAEIGEQSLVATLGNAHGRHLHALAWNRDDRPVQPDREVKSIGQERTFPADLDDLPRLERELVDLADGVAARLRAAGRVGRTVQIKVRFGDFRTISRARTLRDATDLAGDIAATARALLGAVTGIERGVRLLGVSVQQLAPAQAVQPELFEPTGPALAPSPDNQTGPAPGAGAPERGASWDERQALERAVDAVRARFGPRSVGRAAGRVEDHAAVRENDGA